MGKKLNASLLAAGLILSLSCSLTADEISSEPELIPDEITVTDDASGNEEDLKEQTSSGGSDSTDVSSLSGLIEVVSETQTAEGDYLEDVLLAPVVPDVPSTPPSPNLTVNTLSAYPSPTKALQTYSLEYKTADLKYYSDSLFYTCTRHETDSGSYYLTHIVIADASQIAGEDSFGDFGGERETPGAAAERTGAMIAVNGSYFKYETNYATGGNLLIRDNMVFHGNYSDGYEICLRSDGTLFSPGFNTVSSVLAQDVVFSWGTCEDLLIQDGMKCILTDYDWNGARYPRTAIGMVRPLEYYIITAGTCGYAEGITIYEEQQIFSELGCEYARGLDGGGSSALFIDGEYVNENGDRLDDGSVRRRAVADFLLIYDDPSLIESSPGDSSLIGP